MLCSRMSIVPFTRVQFLVPASAWFCSMCKVWLGDNHCASKHIQSNQHSNNYNEFIAKNPHWEMDWLTDRTRSYERKSEARQSQEPVPVPAPPPATTFDSLSNQLLAMIAAGSKAQEASAKLSHEPPPAPPPPPLTKSSSSSSSDDSPNRKSRKKKKKAKKRKSKEQQRSPSKEKVVPTDPIKLNYRSMPERKVDSIPVDDNFISEWMPRVEKREVMALKKKPREEGDGKPSTKRSRRGSGGSREPSSEADKKPSPYEQVTNDHDEAVILDKRSMPHPERDSRNRKKYEEDSKFDRHSRYEKENPKDKNKYKAMEKYRSEKDEKYDDFKTKKDSKFPIERDRVKKSPFSRIKDNIEKKKNKNKVEKTSDEDVHETAFEKRSSESAAKKKDGKKIVLNSLPKTKLPFIGRMPILKKKVEQKPDDKESGKKENSEDDATKDTPEVVAPTEPGEDIGTTAVEQNIDELPKSTLIISKRPRLAEPGIVKKEILFSKPINDNLTEQDMELDDESGIPKEEEPPKDELHKDFKEALDLLFPEDKKEEGADKADGNKEAEVKLEEQQPAVAVAAAGYMMPPGYDVNIYPQYYDQSYVHQQWAQMAGYDQSAAYPGPYAYPPPVVEQLPQVEVVQQPTPEAEQPKKKKNPPSQRLRRHLRKKKAMEAAEKGEGDADEDDVPGEEDGEPDDDVMENGDENKGSTSEPASEGHKPPPDMSDLAMLGIDADDAAAMGFF